MKISNIVSNINNTLESSWSLYTNPRTVIHILKHLLLFFPTQNELQFFHFSPICQGWPQDKLFSLKHLWSLKATISPIPLTNSFADFILIIGNHNYILLSHYFVCMPHFSVTESSQNTSNIPFIPWSAYYNIEHIWIEYTMKSTK